MIYTGAKQLRGPEQWAQVHERIEELGQTITGEARLSPGEVAGRLVERARALAARPSAAQNDETLELVRFELAEEAYALESRFVIEVVGRAEIALLPGAKPPVLGIFAWRGELLVLLHALQGAGRPEASIPDAYRILVLGESQPSFGLLVEGELDLRRISASDIRPLSGGGTTIGAPLAGITDDAVVVIAAAELLRTFT